MGSGISRSSAVGFSALPKVTFGKNEVRTYCQDQWQTMPLLDTHQVRRVEAQIKATPSQPIKKPQAPIVVPAKKTDHSNKKIVALAGIALATGVLCGVVGPFGLILPALVITIVVVKKLMEPPKLDPKVRQEKVEALRHINKLITKHQVAGLKEKVLVYTQIADTLRRELDKQ